MSTTQKTRDYLFDNYKAMLIILVIIGHFIQPCYENNSLLYIVKYFIYAFHMPAFIFISGYFSKRNASFGKCFQRIFMPYFAYEIIYYLYYTYFLNLDTSLNLAKPKFSLWYLFALFIWKVITPYFKKLPHYFLVSVALGLAIGCIPSASTVFSIVRIFVFYPYFLAGTLLDRTLLSETHRNPYRIISIAGITAFLLFLGVFADSAGFKLSFFYGKTSYAKLGQTPLEGILVRLLCYGIGFFLTYAFAILMTEKETIFSKLGSETMSIYLFHGLIFKFFEHGTNNLLEEINTLPESITLLTFCVLLAFALTWKPLCTFTNSFAKLSFASFASQTERSTYYYTRTNSSKRFIALLDA